MYIEKKKLSIKDVQRISTFTSIILFFLFVVLMFAFWNVQVLKNDYYKSLAIKNIYREIEIKAQRGLIVDRNNDIIAENKLDFSLFLVRKNIKDLEKTIKFINIITNIDKKKILNRIKKYKEYPESYSIPIKRNLSLEKVIYIKSRFDEFPEFKIAIEPTRLYPYKKIGSHILGYMGEVTFKELNQKKTGIYNLGENVGKIGVEKQYEELLRGTKGAQIVLKDNLGRIQKVLSEKNPKIGNKIVLTIDWEIQEYIEEIFKDYMGTVGVVDLRTGGILALVSKPNFNPESFSGFLGRDEWNALVNNPNKPLINRFLQGLYLPGSVFKIVMALTGLQEKIISPSTVANCYGSVKIYDRIFHCWNTSGHGSMNLYNGLKNSCNVFFYTLGKKLNIDIIAKYAKMLGFGSRTNMGLPNEKVGLIPTKSWKLKHLHQKWFPGETISVSIGGGMLNVTPAQVLLMISTVALRGNMPQLHILKRIEYNGKVIRKFKPIFNQVSISKKNFEIVIEGLFRAVNDEGTGKAAKVEGLDICGKTGTQPIISKENPSYERLIKIYRFKAHSWFASFAPRNRPEIAVVVFVEHGGDAGIVAAPLAAKIYKKLFE